MMKKFLFIFLLFSGAAFAQNQQIINNLLLKLKTVKHDTMRIRVLNDLSWEYNFGNPSKALYYANEVIAMSKKMSYNWGIAAGYSSLAGYYENEGNYSEAMKYRIINVEINEKHGTPKATAQAYNNIANLYNYLQEFDKSLEFYSKYVRIIKRLKPKNTKALLGTVYNNIASTYKDKKLYDSALIYINTSRDYAAEVKDSFLLSDVYTNMGMIHETLKHDKQALASYLKAIDIATKINSQKSFSLLYANISGIYMNNGDFGEAISYANKALSFAYITEQHVRRMEAYEHLFRIYGKMHDYEKKSLYLEKFIALKDSLLSDKKSTQLNSLMVKFETKQKQEENIILTSQLQIQRLRNTQSNYLIFGLIGLFVITALFVTLLLRQRNLKAQQRSIQLEQKLLRSQMNPHFIFNSLTAVESYIYKNEPMEAGKYLSNFARLMRLILENSREEYIPLAREIKTLEYYLALQQKRFDHAFSYQINVAAGADTESIAIPPMLAQPFIENAIEHGIRDSGKLGMISIHFYLKNKELFFEVEDNGIGFEKSLSMKKKHKDHKSMAIGITMERLKILNGKKSKKILLHIDDPKDAAGNSIGTKLSFSIPFKEI